MIDLDASNPREQQGKDFEDDISGQNDNGEYTIQNVKKNY